MSQAELLSPTPLSPSVSLHSGRPATRSLEVAKFFGKRHDNVLRDIDALLSQLPENSLQLNFEETYQEQETPLGVKQVRMFILYRDGFMLLVMGYTGKKALAMKLAYIEAFNRMEEELARQKEAARNITQDIVDFPGSISITPSSVADRKPLRALVGSWAKLSNAPFDACWNQLKAAFNLANIKELPQEWIADALAWVQAKIDALPAPAPAAALPSPPSAAADEAEDHLAAIQEHVRQIHRHEEALFLLARKALPSIRTAQDMYSPARRMGLNALQSMEDCAGALHHNLRALESAARAMLGMGK